METFPELHSESDQNALWGVFFHFKFSPMHFLSILSFKNICALEVYLITVPGDSFPVNWIARWRNLVSVQKLLWVRNHARLKSHCEIKKKCGFWHEAAW